MSTIYGDGFVADRREWKPDLKPCRCGTTPEFRFGLGVYEVVCPKCAVSDRLPTRAIAKWNALHTAGTPTDGGGNAE